MGYSIEQFQALNRPDSIIITQHSRKRFAERGIRLKDVCEAINSGVIQMKCMRCGREAYKSTTSEAIEMGFGLLVIRNIPCYKCEECDEVFFAGDVVQKIEDITERAKQLMQEVTIIDYSNFNRAA